jgi:hypothetical protein
MEPTPTGTVGENTRGQYEVPGVEVSASRYDEPDDDYEADEYDDEDEDYDQDLADSMTYEDEDY